MKSIKVPDMEAVYGYRIGNFTSYIRLKSSYELFKIFRQDPGDHWFRTDLPLMFHTPTVGFQTIPLAK